MSAIEQAEAYANDAECNVIARAHILALLAENERLRGGVYDPELSLYENVARLRGKAEVLAVPTTPGRICPEYIRDAARFHRLANPNPSHVTAEHIATLNEAANYIEFLEAQLQLSPVQAIDDDDFAQVIDERDNYHEWADKLADAISELTGVDIGEHSSANNPWSAALDAIGEYEPAQAVSVSEGWKLVPIEATLDMGWAYLDKANEEDVLANNRFSHAAYRAMLAAAPQPG